MKVVMRRKSDGKVLTFKNVEKFAKREHGFSVNGNIKSGSKFEFLKVEAVEGETLDLFVSDIDKWGGYRGYSEVVRIEGSDDYKVTTSGGYSWVEVRDFWSDGEFEVEVA